MDAAWIGVVGVLGGSTITLIGNIINNFYLSRKEGKTRQWELEKTSKERDVKQRADMFKVYNAFLKEDGEYQYVRETESSDLKLKDFDRDRYKQVMRPLLMSDLHLLSKDVFELARQLDSYTYDDLNYINHEEWYNDMANIYIELVTEIEKQYTKRL
ncbi:hypothetical protein [Paenibacillus terrigena]|uniref:hypothetical protein n=1 Tax=Paenibacillus terrigena TaxID=369333 RepID=UPI000382B76D|nr:hypothetical protein [Paenibacillus terrigena]